MRECRRRAGALGAAGRAVCPSVLALGAAALAGLLLAMPVADAKTEFWGTSMSFIADPGNPPTPPATTWSISNVGTRNATVDIYNETGLVAQLQVDPMSTQTYSFSNPPKQRFSMLTEVTKRLVHRFASDSDDIRVSQFAPIITKPYVADASTLLPASSLGFLHVVPGYKTEQVVVIAPEKTRLTIVPTVAIDPGPGVPAMAAGNAASFNLSAGQSLRLVANNRDMAGTFIAADRPVSVFAGNECTETYDKKMTSCNHLEEQVLPMQHLGTEYVGCSSASIRPTPGYDFYRVMATQPGITKITLNPAPRDPSPSGYPPGGSKDASGNDAYLVVAPGEVELLGVGAWYEFDVDTHLHIQATQPVSVTQVAGKVNSLDVHGDPSMLLPVPSQRWSPALDFWSPKDWTTSQVLVSAPLGAVVSLDGVPMPAGTPVGVSGFACLSSPIEPGQHQVASEEDVWGSVLLASTYNAMWYPASPSWPPRPVAAFDRSAPTPPPPPLWDPDWDPTALFLQGQEDTFCAARSYLGGYDYAPVVRFVDASTAGVGSLTQSQWEWGDGSSDETYSPGGKETAHPFPQAGDYTVTLTVLDETPLSDTATREIHVVDCPWPPPPNGCPSLAPIPLVRAYVGDLVTLQLAGEDRNPYSAPDPTTYGAEIHPTLPPSAQFDPQTGTLTWQTTSDDRGAYRNLRFFLADLPQAGESCIVMQQATLFVFAASTPPEIRDDHDMDGVADRQDNCPEVPNQGQEDDDGNGIGDRCEAPVTVVGIGLDVREGGGRLTVHDRDRDGIADVQDNCPAVPNRDQLDLDADAAGDACDPDVDGDGISQAGPTGAFLDNCPRTPNASQQDRDQNGAGDACDGSLAIAKGKDPLDPATTWQAPWSWTSPQSWLLAGASAALTLVAVAALRWRRWFPAAIVAFSRLAGLDLMKQPVRATLMELIQASPGLHQRELARAAGRSLSVAAHHLDVLERSGFVRSEEAMGYRRYYPVGVAPAPAEPPALRAGLARQIMASLHEHPGRDTASVARALGEHYTSIQYHVRRLEKAGLIRTERNGRARALHPVAPAGQPPPGHPGHAAPAEAASSLS